MSISTAYECSKDRVVKKTFSRLDRLESVSKLLVQAF